MCKIRCIFLFLVRVLFDVYGNADIDRQEVLVAILVKFGVIQAIGSWTQKDVAMGLQVENQSNLYLRTLMLI